MTHGNEKTQRPGDASIEASTISSSPIETDIINNSYRALHSRDFRLLLSGVFLSMFARQMITVAIGWELYERTSSALILGIVGLAQVIPLVVLFLPAGYIADRYSRKHVMTISQVVMALAMLGLAALSYLRGPLLLIYGCLVVLGGAQSFSMPAMRQSCEEVFSFL